MADTRSTHPVIPDSREIISALREILEMMTATPDLDVIMPYILNITASLIRCKTCSIMLFDEMACYLAWTHGFSEKETNVIIGHRFPLDIPNLIRIQQDRQPYIVADAQAVPGWIKVRGLDWIRSALGVPIALHDRVYGVLTADHDLPAQFTVGHMDVLQIIAHYAAISMANIGAKQGLEQTVIARTAELHARIDAEAALIDQLKRLHDVTVELTMIESLDRLCRRVVELGIARLGIDRLCLYLYDPLTHQAHGTYGTDDSGQVIAEGHIHLSIIDGHSLMRRALLDNARLVIDSTLASDASVGYWRAAAVMWNGITPIGWLVADNELKHQPPAPAVLETLALYSGSVGALIVQLRIAQALRQSLEREQELSQLKSRFISMASHEFRTPLSTILTSAELLARHRHQMTEEQADRRIDKIIEQIHHLTRIMDGVLNLSRMQSGRMLFTPEPVDLPALVREIIAELANRPDRPPRWIEFEARGGPFTLMLDPQLIRQVLTNLISNAMKYAPETAPIHVDLESVGTATRLRVRDQGIGIPEADMRHLFEPFHRGENVGLIAGTGLGLTISRQAVEAHGGQIAVESVVGVGTTFTITLPGRITA